MSDIRPNQLPYVGDNYDLTDKFVMVHDFNENPSRQTKLIEVSKLTVTPPPLEISEKYSSAINLKKLILELEPTFDFATTSISTIANNIFNSETESFFFLPAGVYKVTTVLQLQGKTLLGQAGTRLELQEGFSTVMNTSSSSNISNIQFNVAPDYTATDAVGVRIVSAASISISSSGIFENLVFIGYQTAILESASNSSGQLIFVNNCRISFNAYLYNESNSGSGFRKIINNCSGDIRKMNQNTSAIMVLNNHSCREAVLNGFDESYRFRSFIANNSSFKTIVVASGSHIFRGCQIGNETDPADIIPNTNNVLLEFFDCIFFDAGFYLVDTNKTVFVYNSKMFYTSTTNRSNYGNNGASVFYANCSGNTPIKTDVLELLHDGYFLQLNLSNLNFDNVINGGTENLAMQTSWVLTGEGSITTKYSSASTTNLTVYPGDEIEFLLSADTVDINDFPAGLEFTMSLGGRAIKAEKSIINNAISYSISYKVPVQQKIYYMSFRISNSTPVVGHTTFDTILTPGGVSLDFNIIRKRP